MAGALSTALLLAWMKTTCAHYGVEYEFAHAVGIVESRPKGGGMEMRVGPLGKSGRVVGPMGIAKCFASKYDIYNVFTNVELGVKALRGADKRRVLRRYNPESTPAYTQAVLRTYRQLKRESAEAKSAGQ